MLEHVGQKLITGIILQRVEAVFAKHKVLHPMQFAGVSGGSTADPLFIRQQVCESAQV